MTVAEALDTCRPVLHKLEVYVVILGRNLAHLIYAEILQTLVRHEPAQPALLTVSSYVSFASCSLTIPSRKSDCAVDGGPIIPEAVLSYSHSL